MDYSRDEDGLPRKERELTLNMSAILGIFFGLVLLCGLFFGLGCQRSHSAQEVAQAFGVSVQAVTGLLGAAQRRLAQAGLTSSQLRQAAREEADLRPPSGPVQEARCTERRHTGSHRRC